MRRRIEPVEREVAPAPLQILLREVEAGRVRAGSGRRDGEAAGVGEGVENAEWGVRSAEWEVGGNVAREQAAAVVPLVEEEAVAVALVETEFKGEAVFTHGEALRGCFAEDELRRGLFRFALAHAAVEALVISAAQGELFEPGGKLVRLRGGEHRLGLGEQEVTEPLDLPARPAVCRAVDQTEGIGEFRRRFMHVHHRPAQGQPRVCLKICGGAKSHRLTAGRMGDDQFLCMEENPGGGRAAIKYVAEDGEAAGSGMDTDLMRAAGVGLGLNFPRSVRWVPRSQFESCLRRFCRPACRHALVALAVTSDVAAHHEIAGGRGPVAHQQVTLHHPALLKLISQRFVGLGRFAEDQHATGFLVEPVQDGEFRPARFPVTQPVIDALAGMRSRSVGVPAGGFVDHQ